MVVGSLFWCPRCGVRTSWLRLSHNSGHGGIYLLYLIKANILSIFQYNWKKLLRPPLPHQCAYSSSARFDPLGACHSCLLLSEEDKVETEQFELAGLLESTLPCLHLVIHFIEFLQVKEVSSRKQNGTKNA